MALTEKITAIANAIRTKTGGSSLMTLPEMATAISNIPTGGGDEPVANPALRLIDWEGTILKEYSKEDALALEALPAPSTLSAYAGVDHELLLFQEWNWSLADIKTWLTNHTQGKLNVGAIYTTTDGQDHNYWANPRGDGAKLINKQKRGTASIGYNAFDYCYSLTSINIPDGVTSIGGYAFYNCYSLPSINIPDSVTSIGGYAFYSCPSLMLINIPDSVTSIGGNAFEYCYSLTSINIPDGVTSIGGSTFENCYSLTSINIPDGVTSIGAGAFSGCYSLMSINIPDSVVSIRSNAFYNCYSLPSINIPDSVTSIGAVAFSGCKNLFDILLESKPTLSSTDGLSGTPSTQKIYVPRANLSWFETATNWATYYNRFVAIEDNIEYLESLGYNVDAYKTGGAE